MNILTTFLLKIGHLLLSLLRVLRRAVCCRRKRHETEMLLPMTNTELHYSSSGMAELPSFDSDLHSWESWNENEQSVSVGVDNELNRLSNGAITGRRNSLKETQEEADDFFKDMVPQLRKPKKLIIHDEDKSHSNVGYPSRLSMDPRMPMIQSELGILDDSPSTWEDSENLEEIWDPDILIREKRMAEREKRLAEHQRRKLEKESRRLSKQDPYLADKLS